MASHASVPARGLPPKPPDKGSFPLDHFGECSEPKKAYMACLKEHGMQAQSEACRILSAAYLQCRMDTELMAKEQLEKLGFRRSAAPSPEASDASPSTEQRRRGFLAGLREPGR